MLWFLGRFLHVLRDSFFGTASGNIHATAFASASGKVHVMGSLRAIVVVLWAAAAEDLKEELPTVFARALAMTSAWSSNRSSVGI